MKIPIQVKLILYLPISTTKTPPVVFPRFRWSSCWICACRNFRPFSQASGVPVMMTSCSTWILMRLHIFLMVSSAPVRHPVRHPKGSKDAQGTPGRGCSLKPSPSNPSLDNARCGYERLWSIDIGYESMSSCCKI